jgi:hypothetical protein
VGWQHGSAAEPSQSARWAAAAVIRRALAWSISDNFGPAAQQVLAGDPVQRAEADLPGPRMGGSVRSGPVGAL